MSQDQELERNVQAELARLRQQEAEKKALYDYGGEPEPTLRPSKEFIERNVGPLKSDAELHQEAQQTAVERQAYDRFAAENRQQVEQSMREHQQRIEDRARQESQAVSLPDRSPAEQAAEASRSLWNSPPQPQEASRDAALEASRALWQNAAPEPKPEPAREQTNTPAPERGNER